MLPSRLKALRLSHQMTQKELSQRLNVTPKVVSFYELGQRRPPQETLVKIASIFDVSVDYLLGVTNYERASEAAKSSGAVPVPTTDLLSNLFADDPDTLARLNQAAIKINSLDAGSVSDEAKLLIKNALIMAVKEVDRVNGNN